MTKPIILQVDDEESDVFMLRSAFADAEIVSPVHVARDGQQAMDYLSGSGAYADRRLYPLPNLVLLDLKLPKRMGLEVLAWMRQQPALQHIVVIVLSSSSFPADVQAAYALGANSYVEKPTDYFKAVDLAKVLKGWWLGVNRYHEP